MAKHYLIFIHGIGEREPNQPMKQSYKESDRELYESYNLLWNHVARSFNQKTQGEFKQKFDSVCTDWHTQEIHLAEATVYNKAFPTLAEQKLSIMRPLRNFATFFLGDVIAYVSEDVNVICRTVWQKMWAELERPLKEENATYSIIAHSLGTVIAFDYLFCLFQKNQLFVPISQPEESNPPIQISPKDIQLLQDRFRHFFTFGSPIGLFMLRKGSLWVNREPFQHVYNPVRGDGRTWLNFYDPKDVIAYPLKGVFDSNPENQNCSLEDISINTAFTPLGAHTNYWKNQKLAQAIAERLAEPEVVAVEPGLSDKLLLPT